MRKEGVFREFVTFVKDEKGDPLYETTLQYAILKKRMAVLMFSPIQKIPLGQGDFFCIYPRYLETMTIQSLRFSV